MSTTVRGRFPSYPRSFETPFTTTVDFSVMLVALEEPLQVELLLHVLVALLIILLVTLIHLLLLPLPPPQQPLPSLYDDPLPHSVSRVQTT